MELKHSQTGKPCTRRKKMAHCQLVTKFSPPPGDSEMIVAAYGTYIDLETVLQSDPGDSASAGQMAPCSVGFLSQSILGDGLRKTPPRSQRPRRRGRLRHLYKTRARRRLRPWGLLGDFCL